MGFTTLHGYPTRKIEGGKQSAQNAIESIKKKVPNAEVDDQT